MKYDAIFKEQYHPNTIQIHGEYSNSGNTTDNIIGDCQVKEILILIGVIPTSFWLTLSQAIQIGQLSKDLFILLRYRLDFGMFKL